MFDQISFKSVILTEFSLTMKNNLKWIFYFPIESFFDKIYIYNINNTSFKCHPQLQIQKKIRRTQFSVSSRKKIAITPSKQSSMLIFKSSSLSVFFRIDQWFNVTIAVFWRLRIWWNMFNFWIFCIKRNQSLSKPFFRYFNGFNKSVTSGIVLLKEHISFLTGDSEIIVRYPSPFSVTSFPFSNWKMGWEDGTMSRLTTNSDFS